MPIAEAPKHVSARVLRNPGYIRQALRSEGPDGMLMTL